MWWMFLPQLLGSLKQRGDQVWTGLLLFLSGLGGDPALHQVLVQVKQLVHQLPNLHQQIHCAGHTHTQDRWLGGIHTFKLTKEIKRRQRGPTVSGAAHDEAEAGGHRGLLPYPLQPQSRHVSLGDTREQ